MRSTRLRTLSRHFPFGCGATDTSGRVLWMNAAGAAFVGTTPRQARNADIRSLWPAAPSPLPRRPETRIEHGMVNGRGVWLRVTRLPIDGEVVAVAEDVTAVVRYATSRALLRNVDNDPIAMAIRLGIPLD